MLRGWLNKIQYNHADVLDHLIEVTQELSENSKISDLSRIEIQCALRNLKSARITLRRDNERK